MEIEIFDGNLSKKDVKQNRVRTACRGVVQKDGLILTVYEEKWDITTLPGGGLEENETVCACVVREVKEETGVIVENPVEMVRVIEHFEHESFVSIYFSCEFVEETGIVEFTELEKAVNLQTKWLYLDDLLDILSTNMTKHEYGVNIHNREFIGLINSI